ncbi:serine/threonine-protein kinase Nek8-like [Pieris rapae]|uniref:serine/threonine-protein kinase Nek8-like n=1 Tax=Pieris rapae TaxID=64459 RepID=UPI001E27CBE4|nr:serine/threonine-protein kinase Nek8-like [Pieris rapae]
MDINKRFKRFHLKVLKTIGQGTYGSVFLCERRKDKSLTIVKDIELNVKMQAHHKDCTNEVKILATMNHPNIIQFYNCHYTDSHVLICMEYATSGNLAEFMYQKCPRLIKQEEILFYYCQVLLGVNYIHGLDIIHRDLKAENILLSGKNGVLVKIGDFGISKMLASAKKTSTVIGTPYYLAPELCEGKPYDTKSDIWALGCLLYEMCTHKRAFDAESLMGLVKVITSGSVTPIDLSVYERGVQDLIDAMLSVLPDKRPTIKEILSKKVLLSMIYTVYLDAGDDKFLNTKIKEFV